MPRLARRITGHVRAVLSEILDDREQTYELSIPIWANVTPVASPADIGVALMLKAAKIIARLKKRHGRGRLGRLGKCLKECTLLRVQPAAASC
ncbi:MAG: hypothetical protein MO846_08540 [Candidatus Devosia symbiotica]|nr:hypothetical protein [Candidatus Devosia symbiotica]